MATSRENGPARLARYPDRSGPTPSDARSRSSAATERSPSLARFIEAAQGEQRPGPEVGEAPVDAEEAAWDRWLSASRG